MICKHIGKPKDQIVWEVMRMIFNKFYDRSFPIPYIDYVCHKDTIWHLKR